MNQMKKPMEMFDPEIGKKYLENLQNFYQQNNQVQGLDFNLFSNQNNLANFLRSNDMNWMNFQNAIKQSYPAQGGDNFITDNK